MNAEPGTASADATAYDLAFTLEERDYIAFMTVARRSGSEKVMMMILTRMRTKIPSTATTTMNLRMMNRRIH